MIDGWNPFCLLKRMDVVNIMLEGIFGTLLMTGYVYLASKWTGKEIKAVRILGTMLTLETSMNGRLSRSHRALIVGMTAHYTVGVLFSTIYNGLWTLGIGRPTLLGCIIFGGISGIFAIFVWSGFFRIHPKPPYVEKTVFLPVIATGHLFFGLGMYLAVSFLIQHMH